MTGDARHQQPPEHRPPGGRSPGADTGDRQPPAVLDQGFDNDSLYALREAVAAHAMQAGLAEGRVGDLVLAVHELASNAIRHGGGRGRLRAAVRGWAPRQAPAISVYLVKCGRRGQTELMRVVVTRISQDGTMRRRMVDTAASGGFGQWEELAARALAAPSPYHPVPGGPVYHLRVDDHVVLVAEHDLSGPLYDLVTAVLAMGEAPH
jgi:Histidine kinase-like ATPase domain